MLTDKGFAVWDITLTDEAVEPILLLHTEIPALNLDGINIKRKRKRLYFSQKVYVRLNIFMISIKYYLFMIFLYDA